MGRRWRVGAAGGVLALVLLAPGIGVAQGPTELTRTEAGVHGLVDVGGYRLYLECAGAGSPTVVLDAGFSSGAAAWARVQPGAAAFAHVCAYDRVNRGRSDRSETPAAAERLAADLHALLLGAEVPGPYVLVGQSFGGLLSRVFAAHYPADVAGLVLVDAVHEAYYGDGPGAVALPAGGILQGVDLRRSGVEARDAGPLPDVPLLVLARGGPDPRFTPEANQRWPEWEADLAARAPRGELRMVEGSGHDMHLDRPDAVVDAIRAVVEAAGSGAT